MSGLEEKMTHFMVGSLYQPLDVIRECTYGVVYSAIHLLTQHKVAIKCITPFNHSMFCLHILHEIKLLCHFHHENIITYSACPCYMTWPKSISSRTVSLHTGMLHNHIACPYCLWPSHSHISIHSHNPPVHLLIVCFWQHLSLHAHLPPWVSLCIHAWVFCMLSLPAHWLWTTDPLSICISHCYVIVSLNQQKLSQCLLGGWWFESIHLIMIKRSMLYLYCWPTKLVSTTIRIPVKSVYQYHTCPSPSVHSWLPTCAWTHTVAGVRQGRITSIHACH